MSVLSVVLIIGGVILGFGSLWLCFCIINYKCNRPPANYNSSPRSSRSDYGDSEDIESFGSDNEYTFGSLDMPDGEGSHDEDNHSEDKVDCSVTVDEKSVIPDGGGAGDGFVNVNHSQSDHHQHTYAVNEVHKHSNDISDTKDHWTNNWSENNTESHSCFSSHTDGGGKDGDCGDGGGDGE